MKGEVRVRRVPADLCSSCLCCGGCMPKANFAPQVARDWSEEAIPKGLGRGERGNRECASTWKLDGS